MRLLMISFHFAPFTESGSIRVAKTAQYLTHFGHEIRVVTSRAQPAQQTLPRCATCGWTIITTCIPGGGKSWTNVSSVGSCPRLAAW